MGLLIVGLLLSLVFVLGLIAGATFTAAIQDEPPPKHGHKDGY